MKKQLITIGIISVCLLVLIIVFELHSDTEEQGEDTQEILLETKTEDIIWSNITNHKGGYHVTWKDGNAEVSQIEKLPIDEFKVRKFTENISSFIVQKEIKEGIERLADFGLDEPKAKVELKIKDKKNITLSIGDRVPEAEGNSRYVSLGNGVYVMDEDRVESFFYGTCDFISDEVSPSYEEVAQGENTALVTKVRIKRETEEPLVISLLGSEKMAGYLVNSYQITSPIYYPASADITEEFLITFFDIKSTEVVSVNATEEEYKKYGLTVPYIEAEVEYQDANADKRTFVLKASGSNEKGEVYMQRDDDPIIYKCKSETLSWLNTDVETLITKEILVPDIRTISELTIKTNEKVYKIQLKNIGEENEEVSCNGKTLDVDSFRNLYYMLISQSATEVIFDEMPDVDELERKAEVIYTYTDENKKEDDLIFYKESVRKLCAILNSGERGYRLSSAGLETFLANLEKFSSGEKIEAQY